MIAFLLFLIFLVLLVGTDGFLLLCYAAFWLLCAALVLGLVLLAAIAVLSETKLQAYAGAVLVLAFCYEITTIIKRKWQESKARKELLKASLESYRQEENINV